MKRALVLWVLVGSVVAGCTGADTNPHLAAPKLVIGPMVDGNVTLFVHSSFGERAYDSMRLRVDNATVAERANGYSLEASVGGSVFFVEVEVDLNGQSYDLRALVYVDSAERARVSILKQDGLWAGPDSYGLPHERIIERVTS